MDTEVLVGMRVINTNTRAIGTIEYVRDGIVAVDFYETISKCLLRNISVRKMFLSECSFEDMLCIKCRVVATG